MNETGSGANIFEDWSPGEWMLAGAAAWILVVDYLFGFIIQEEYGSALLDFTAPLSLAVVVAIFVRHGAKGSKWNDLYPATIRAAAIGIAFFTAGDVLNSLANEFTENGEFYEITAYLAGAVAAVGAFQLGQEGS